MRTSVLVIKRLPLSSKPTCDAGAGNLAKHLPLCQRLAIEALPTGGAREKWQGLRGEEGPVHSCLLLVPAASPRERICTLAAHLGSNMQLSFHPFRSSLFTPPQKHQHRPASTSSWVPRGSYSNFWVLMTPDSALCFSQSWRWKLLPTFTFFILCLCPHLPFQFSDDC